MAETIKTRADLEQIKNSYVKSCNAYSHRVMVCGGGGCISSGCPAVENALRGEIESLELSESVQISVTGCMGLCALGPVMLVQPGNIFYVEMTPERVKDIIQKHVLGGEIVEEYTYYDPVNGKHIPKMDDIGFYKQQIKIALRNCGEMDFSSLDEYISRDGYFAAESSLKTLSPEDIVAEITNSGLRGRGGAGFPTGIKWAAGMNAPKGQKYIICNADEGDPGAFMDRSILEGDPHSIIEGMILGAYTIGADKGFVYVRAEYPIAIERLQATIEQAEAAGILGKNIFGSGIDFELEIRIGAGAFVCGEETALIASIEGKCGEPRQKPPFPFQSGLFGCPTIINNVETLANIVPIMLKGAQWYAQYGTEKSKGTKVFALAGDIINSGIIEIPMGVSLRDIVYNIGGGIIGGKAFKAIQSGGPSGGCLPEDNLDASVDYESLTQLGAIMGSGGLIVMDVDTCMVDTARYFLDFIQDESCGKCNPCRIGTKHLFELLEKICKGNGTMADLTQIEQLCVHLQTSSLCALGQTAPNPVTSTLRYFKDEYIQHIDHKRCPANICQGLISIAILPDKCTGCTRCKGICPVHAISGQLREPHTIDQSKCIKCGVCLSNCNFGAIVKV